MPHATLLNRIILQAACGAGGLTRAAGEDRIEFLAKVRNLALEPLWRESGRNGSAAVTGEGFRANRIIFINDVYFCVRDVVR